MALFIVDYYFLFYKQHEDASVNMFDHMVKVNNLLPNFTEYNLTEKDVIFIKELIAGTALDTNNTQVSLYWRQRNMYLLAAKEHLILILWFSFSITKKNQDCWNILLACLALFGPTAEIMLALKIKQLFNFNSF